MHLHDWDREVRTQHQLPLIRVVRGEGARADVFAIKVEQRVGADQHGRLNGDRIREDGLKRLRLGPYVRLEGHWWRAIMACTSATRSARGTSVCAG